MLFFYLSYTLKIVLVLLAIAFITLLERKILSYSQLRIGPNKVILKGLLQPVLDGVKLLVKEFYFPKKLFFWGIWLGPLLGFLVILFLWSLFEPLYLCKSNIILLLFLIVLIGLGVYSTLISGWRANSKFAEIGRIRSCSQSISYEISLIFFVICLLIFFGSLKINFLFIISLLPIVICFFLRCVAETNRAPFDFREGERELISGFNVEYGSAPFVLLFLAEYGIIILFSFLLRYLFFSFFSYRIIFFFMLFLFIRRVYPRFRYDILIKITWYKFLPLSLFFIFLSLLLY